MFRSCPYFCPLHLDESVGDVGVKRNVFPFVNPDSCYFVWPGWRLSQGQEIAFGSNIITVICPGKQDYNKAFHIQIFKTEKKHLIYGYGGAIWAGARYQPTLAYCRYRKQKSASCCRRFSSPAWQILDDLLNLTWLSELLPLTFIIYSVSLSVFLSCTTDWT